MQVFYHKAKIEVVISAFKQQHKTIGFVPTMGALHKGHLTLIEKALAQNNEVIVSIFVNPTQFNNTKDLEQYPRTQDEDIKMLSDCSQDIIVYVPDASEIYGKNPTSTSFDFDGLDKQLEGKFRPGHFDGVGTVLKLFFESLRPDRAYFGEKDFQQLQIIRKLVAQEQLPVTIVECPVYREQSGLAFSSRNKRLNERYREKAPFIYKTLRQVKTDFGTKSAVALKQWVISEFKTQDLLKLEYFEIAEETSLEPVSEIKANASYRAFIAVFAGDVRLIDTIALN